MDSTVLDLVIVGLGPAGLTASLYAKMYGLQAIGVGDVVGGKLISAPLIVDYPSQTGIKGIDFIAALLSQVKEQACELLVDDVIQIIKLDPQGFEIYTKSQKALQAKNVLIASGNSNKQYLNRARKLLTHLGVNLVNGFIVVNDRFESSVSNIFSAGDCIQYPRSLEQLTTAVTSAIQATACIYEKLKQAKPPILWGKTKIPRIVKV